MRADRRNLEHLTDALSGEPIRTELIGPGSALQRVLGDLATTLYGALAVLVLGTAQREAIQGLKDHEEIFRKASSTPEGTVSDGEVAAYGVRRLKESVELVGGIVFAVTDQDRADAAFALRELHRKVRGRLDDGSAYHAWQPEVWANAWAGIVWGLMASYDTFRGFDDDRQREEALAGFVELGRVFGVRGLPARWDDFEAYWEDFVAEAVVDDTIGTIAGIVRNGAFGRVLRRSIRQGGIRPGARVALALPLFRVLRVGAIATFPVELDDDLGIERTRFDRVEMRVHQLVWRAVPKAVSTRFLPVAFRVADARGVEPVWRTRFARPAFESDGAVVGAS